MAMLLFSLKACILVMVIIHKITIDNLSSDNLYQNHLYLLKIIRKNIAEMRNLDKKAIAEMHAAAREARKPHSITEESFETSNGKFTRLFYDPQKNIAVFHRQLSMFSECWEVVEGVGKDLRYPTNEQFGRHGWCYPCNPCFIKKIYEKTGFKIERV